MKVYKVLCNDLSKIDNAIFLEEKFSWSFLFFNILWAIYKGFWPLVLALIVFKTTIFSFYTLLEPKLISFLYFSVIIYIAFNAIDLYCIDLCNKGYKILSIILAENEELARLKFYTEYLNNDKI